MIPPEALEDQANILRALADELDTMAQLERTQLSGIPPIGAVPPAVSIADADFPLNIPTNGHKSPTKAELDQPRTTFYMRPTTDWGTTLVHIKHELIQKGGPVGLHIVDEANNEIESYIFKSVEDMEGLRQP
jgi:hypothetical protein